MRGGANLPFIAPAPFFAGALACYAILDYVVNYGEGIRPWSHETMSDIFYNGADIIGRILLDTVRTLAGADKACACEILRKETLLKDVYSESSDKG